MRKGWLLAAACLCAHGLARYCAGQSSACEFERDSAARVCECGAHPPAPPRDRDGRALCGEPEDLSPYAKFAEPYYHNYISSQHLHRRGARNSRSQGHHRGAHRLLRPHRAQSRPGLRIAHAARRAVGGGRGQRARRLRRQALPADAAQRLRQLAGEGGLWRRPAHRSHHLGLGLERSREDDLRRPGLGDLRLDQLRVDAHHAAPGAARPRFPSSTPPPPIPRFPRPIFPGTSPICRTIACRASRWRAASIPNWA